MTAPSRLIAERRVAVAATAFTVSSSVVHGSATKRDTSLEAGAGVRR